jgi:hypothetical protein
MSAPRSTGLPFVGPNPGRLPDTDIAGIIGEARQRVAQESERQAAENAVRFKAAVEAEVQRRLAL